MRFVLIVFSIKASLLHAHAHTLLNTHTDFDPEQDFSVEESLTELSELVGTAGLEVVGSTYQKVGESSTGKARTLKTHTHTP